MFFGGPKAQCFQGEMSACCHGHTVRPEQVVTTSTCAVVRDMQAHLPSQGKKAVQCPEPSHLWLRGRPATAAIHARGRQRPGAWCPEAPTTVQHAGTPQALGKGEWWLTEGVQAAVHGRVRCGLSCRAGSSEPPDKESSGWTESRGQAGMVCVPVHSGPTELASHQWAWPATASRPRWTPVNKSPRRARGRRNAQSLRVALRAVALTSSHAHPMGRHPQWGHTCTTAVNPPGARGARGHHGSCAAVPLCFRKVLR